jgi:hypothetical protein
LGDEGYAAPGLSLNVGFNPSSSSALNFFAESLFLTKTPLQEKGAEQMASGVFHGWWHQEISSSHAVDVGLSGLLGRKGKKDSGLFVMLGGDVHYSYAPAGIGPNARFLFGNEFFSANQNGDGGRWPMGNFTWAQVLMFGSTFAGVRYDLAPQEENLMNFRHAMGAYLSHYTTEFLRFRLGYEHVMPEINSLAGDHRVMLSMIFIIGSHPAEPYFVNR